jgi:hypothetical protein
MEFLRFGSSIPGGYWGCCACCIIQNFKMMPTDKASIELVDGDGGSPLGKFAGPTYEDIFRQRIRIGTFSSRDMPNHAFFAILTKSQVAGAIGKAWLKILKEEGFEFIRSVDNSVYSGTGTIAGPGEGCTSSHPNYIFGLFRNIGSGAMANPFKAPAEWASLPSVVTEAYQFVSTSKKVTEEHQKYQLERWKNNKPKPLMTEAQVVAAGVPVTLAGQRSRYPQQEKSTREKVKKLDKNIIQQAAAPFTKPAKAQPVASAG